MSNLARKLVFKAHEQQLVLRKNPQERLAHVYMKAFLWALYHPLFPAIKVEHAIGDRFKPDLVALDLQGHPVYWGEAGLVSKQKYAKLLRRYPATHFAFARWKMSLQQHLKMVSAHVNLKRRSAPVDVLVFPDDAPERWVQDGQIELRFADLQWQRLQP